MALIIISSSPTAHSAATAACCPASPPPGLASLFALCHSCIGFPETSPFPRGERGREPLIHWASPPPERDRVGRGCLPVCVWPLFPPLPAPGTRLCRPLCHSASVLTATIQRDRPTVLERASPPPPAPPPFLPSRSSRPPPALPRSWVSLRLLGLLPGPGPPALFAKLPTKGLRPK